MKKSTVHIQLTTEGTGNISMESALINYSQIMVSASTKILTVCALMSGLYLLSLV